MNNTINQPEKIGFWDRLFNRYRKVIHQRGEETWNRRNCFGEYVPNSSFTRNWIEYKTIDRVTGSETISREYLN